MKVSTWVAAAAAVLAVGFGQATFAQATNSQQEKMKTCSDEAKTKAPSGEARKQFMSNCLKGSNAGGTNGGANKK